MQKHVNLVDLVKSFPTNIYLQNLASIQKRTSPLKFAHLAEKSGKGSISNLSTKVCPKARVRRADLRSLRLGGGGRLSMYALAKLGVSDQRRFLVTGFLRIRIVRSPFDSPLGSTKRISSAQVPLCRRPFPPKVVPRARRRCSIGPGGEGVRGRWLECWLPFGKPVLGTIEADFCNENY